MNAFLRRLFLLCSLVLMFSSCIQVGNPGTEDITRYIRKTNLDSSQFPWIPGLADGRTKRWDIERDGLIPVKLNGSPLATQAIEKIEAELQMPIFDRDSISDLSDDMIRRGIIVSEGTAIGPNGRINRFTCGHVSAQPNGTDYPQNFYDTDGRINTRLYVNLSSKKCTASLDIAIHEFGHALGLGNHFPGFGSGDIISPAFWQVLNTLYHNEAGTPGEELKIVLPDEG